MRIMEPQRVPWNSSWRWCREAALLSGRCLAPCILVAMTFGLLVLMTVGSPVSDLASCIGLLCQALQVAFIHATEHRRGYLATILQARSGWLSLITLAACCFLGVWGLRAVGWSASSYPEIHGLWIRASLMVIDQACGWLLAPPILLFVPLLVTGLPSADSASQLARKGTLVNLKPLAIPMVGSLVFSAIVRLVAMATWPPILLVVALALQPLLAGYMYAAYRHVFLGLPPIEERRAASSHSLATEGST
ncbi:hypothetical protein IMW82_13275 [Rhodanobacter sp. B2A1Ga4]|uniref:hypothetical protein n=1 Tax=Rhodanobacter sp. B2A1Ga4 TaxID=2778647 RepID=UPI001B388423|nr:hypothetical protein [Rhodanobacter sp. B2A1Ga4]MBQ4855643.1 hypothetical protein [Rhodanobacter sp. B2A1Ga4]